MSGFNYRNGDLHLLSGVLNKTYEKVINNNNTFKTHNDWIVYSNKKVSRSSTWGSAMKPRIVTHSATRFGSKFMEIYTNFHNHDKIMNMFNQTAANNELYIAINDYSSYFQNISQGMISMLEDFVDGVITRLSSKHQVIGETQLIVWNLIINKLNYDELPLRVPIEDKIKIPRKLKKNKTKLWNKTKKRWSSTNTDYNGKDEDDPEDIIEEYGIFYDNEVIKLRKQLYSMNVVNNECVHNVLQLFRTELCISLFKIFIFNATSDDWFGLYLNKFGWRSFTQTLHEPYPDFKLKHFGIDMKLPEHKEQYSEFKQKYLGIVMYPHNL